jgi:hypothetical protein
MKFDPFILLFALMVVGFAWRGCEIVSDGVAAEGAP